MCLSACVVVEGASAEVSCRGLRRKCSAIWLLRGALMVQESVVTLQVVITNGVMSVVLSFSEKC